MIRYIEQRCDNCRKLRTFMLDYPDGSCKIIKTKNNKTYYICFDCYSYLGFLKDLIVRNGDELA